MKTVGDTERRVDDEGRRGRIPGRITASLERIANASVGERRRIGLLLDEQFAGELLQNPAQAVRVGKRIVLLGRTSRQGLEPMGIVVGTVLQRPLAHARRDTVGNLPREGRTVLHRIDKGVVSSLVQILAHGCAPEYPFPEIVRRTSFGSLHLDGGVVYGRIDHLESEQ